MPNDVINDEFISEVCERLCAGKSVRRELPGNGLLSIDRQLPFLCVYRRDPDFEDAGTRAFANHEAAYLSAPGDARVRQGLTTLVQRIVETSSKQFGQFLILEVRSAPDHDALLNADDSPREQHLPVPGFRIHTVADFHSTEAINTLHFGLEDIRIDGRAAKVDVRLSENANAPGLTPLLSTKRQRELNCHLIGLEILPIYRDPKTGVLLPEVLEKLQRSVSKVLKKTFYSFVLSHTNLRPDHYYALGRSRIAKSVWEIDRQLSTISQQLNILLLATPINAESSWYAFRDGQFQHEPIFQTRPLPFAPFLLKRELMGIQTEHVQDPTLAHLFRQVQGELDRQLTMMADIGTKRFHLGSLQVFDGVELPLLELANQLLDMTAAHKVLQKSECVSPEMFAQHAELEVEKYRQLDPSFKATVELRHDLYSGLMVSGTQLLVGRETSVSVDRISALLSHEIGTHLVTRHNGAKQPMQLLQSGLAGYDPLQEGLAVLAEFMVGGLTVSRLRMLAARVVATDAMICGADFRETFRLLTESHGFEHHSAFTIVLRIFRGGGLTKDAAYLRGLNQVIQYLAAGGELEPLFVGKLATTHIPLIKELLLREVLIPPAVLPLYLTTPSCAANLAKLRTFQTVLDLANELMASSATLEL